MAKDLGQTADPKELVPGSTESIASTVAWLKSYGDTLHSTGEGLRRIDTVEGWSGKAGDAFRHAFHGEPKKWLVAGDCFHEASTALAGYQSTLAWAQGQAADAIRQWDEGRAATGKAKSEHQDAERNAGHGLPFTDPGEAARAAAAQTLKAAREQLKNAGDTAARTIGKVRDKAPKEPGWLDKVGDFFSDAGDFAVDLGKTAVEDLASVGNAMIHDPGAVLEVAGGLSLAALGAGGEVLGAGLDLTGAGAVIGVPVNVLSAGMIATGAGMAGMGASQIIEDAAGPNRVHMEGDGGGGGGGAGEARTQPSRGPDPNATPQGSTTRINPGDAPENRLALQRENESAEILAKQGYHVEQNPSVPGPKNPDYRIEGEIFDCVSPSSSSARNVGSRIEEKIQEGQTNRIVVNLADSPVDVAALKSQLHDWPIEGLHEAVVIDRQGNILHIYP
ncbi:putative T7SS-secreted protein [Kitasatospora sp. NPDC004723]|uniref:putative T7SS-secreted protein n=1 Tax=Kitasatospora sp. NPDC004723 TaxID=3154288 RepID=UPI0033BACFDC